MTQPTPERLAAIREPEDFEWARERVTNLCASAYADAVVYGKKLLRGFGYPNETFRAAQDARALSIALDALTALTSERDAWKEQAEKSRKIAVHEQQEGARFADAAERRAEKAAAERDKWQGIAATEADISKDALLRAQTAERERDTAECQCADAERFANTEGLRADAVDTFVQEVSKVLLVEKGATEDVHD